MIMLRSTLLLSLLAVSGLQAAQPAVATAPGDGGQDGDPAATIADQPLDDTQRELLDMAFSAASAFPLEPHVKNRSRAQAKVVEACFELDQPRRALDYTRHIANWRRGVGYSRYAVYGLEHGDTDVMPYLELAERALGEARDHDEQGWRIDSIRMGIAQAWVLLGDFDRAERYEAGLDERVAGDMGAFRAGLLSLPKEARAQLALVDPLFADGSFDRTENAMKVCVALFGRFYGDDEIRAGCEKRIKTHMTRLPREKAILRFTDMARIALDHGDAAKARELLESAEAIMWQGRWTAEYLVPMIARIAEVKQRLGDEKQAASELEGALDMYQAERHRIIDMFRAEALAPLAEAHHAVGNREAALEVYKLALQEAGENPNSRPRAEDLSELCTSMALTGFQPDDELWAGLRELRASLGDPW